MKQVQEKDYRARLWRSETQGVHYLFPVKSDYVRLIDKY